VGRTHPYNWITSRKETKGVKPEEGLIVVGGNDASLCGAVEK